MPTCTNLHAETPLSQFSLPFPLYFFPPSVAPSCCETHAGRSCFCLCCTFGHTFRIHHARILRSKRTSASWSDSSMKRLGLRRIFTADGDARAKSVTHSSYGREGLTANHWGNVRELQETDLCAVARANQENRSPKVGHDAVKGWEDCCWGEAPWRESGRGSGGQRQSQRVSAGRRPGAGNLNICSRSRCRQEHPQHAQKWAVWWLPIMPLCPCRT